MKVTVNIECSPEEARQFFGLPDVKPMQDAVMADIEQRVRQGMTEFSPQALLRQWFPALPLGADQLTKVMDTFRSAWTPKGADKERDKDKAE